MALTSSYDASGKLQFNDEMLTMCLRKTGTVAAVFSGFGTEVSFIRVVDGTDEDFIVLNCADGYGATVMVNTAPDTGRFYVTNAPIGTVFNYYIYSNSADAPPVGSIYELYTAGSVMTFSAHYRTLLAPALLEDVERGNFPTFTLLGKKLGFCLLGYGGFKEYQNIDPDSGGWSYDHIWYGYGAGLTGGQDTIETYGVVTDDGRYFTPLPGFDFSNIYDTPCSVLVVDVTGIPIGVTFF